MAVALVTGASAGLGTEFARLLAQDGHTPILVARNESRLNDLAASLKRDHNVDAIVRPADLSNPESPRAIFNDVKTRGLEVAYLINNAGFGSNGPFASLEAERELAMIQVNIASLVHLTHLFLPAMIERGAGRVMNIASTAGFQPGPRMATYYATKAFVISFSEAIAHELKGTGVTVTAHCPGATATEFASIAGNDKSRLFKKAAVADAKSVAEHAYRAMMRGKVLSIHGAVNWMGTFSTRFTPRGVVRTVAGWINEPPPA